MKKSGLILAGLLVASAANADWKQWIDSAKEGLTQSPTSVPGLPGAALSNDQVVEGLKEALRVGAEKAISLLGREGGFLDDQQVRIPLPGALDTVGSGLRAMGQGALVDEFEETMNRAAEKAVPETVDIFSDTIRGMTLEDARNILDGGDTAATDYFRKNSSARLGEAILPIVSGATADAGVTAAYKALIGRAGFLGSYVDMDALDLDRFVTEKALDGLFLKLAQEEKLIRQDPVARTTDILKTVFGKAGG